MSISRTTALSWLERGPNQVAGRVRAVLIDKRDATGNTIFAGGVSGGIWRCDNFKSNPVWSSVNDNLPNMAITCIAQDPATPNTMYVGTGEGWFNADALRGNGIMKSIDGGATWNFLTATQFPTTDDFDYVQDIMVTANGTIYASCRSFRFCNRGGVLRSTDGGNVWTRVIGSFPTGSTSCAQALDFRGADLEMASNGDLYATTGLGSTGKLWRSAAALAADQGTVNNWTDITPPGSWQRIELAVAPSNPAIMYTLLENTTNNGIGGIRRSDNSGATWNDCPLPTWCDQGSTSSDFTRTQAFYDLIARVDPSNPSICYIGGVDILKTSDAGLSWSQVTQWAANCSGLPQIHADQHEIQFYPGSSTEMIAANDGGIYYSANAGTSWINKNTGFRITQYYSVDHHPTLPDYFLAGAQDNGTHRFTQPGINTTTSVLGGDGAFCHIDQTDGQIQVVSVTGNNYRFSRNGGSSFGVVAGGSSTTGRFINPTDYDDALDVMYTAHNADNYGLVLDLNGAVTPTLTVVNVASALVGRQISAIKVDPNVAAGGTVWIAGSTSETATSSAIPNLTKLTSANTNTPVIDRTFPLPLSAGAYISCIEVEKGNANHILVTASNYGVASILESTDGGTTWVTIEGNLPDIPVRWAVFAPANAQLNGPGGGNGGIIIATELGIWTTSTTAGASTFWIPNNTNFVNTRVDMLRYRATDNLLVAATHGRGLFTTNIPTIVTSINQVNNTRGFIQYISTQPQQLYIKTGNLTGVRTMNIQLFDAAGRLLQATRSSYSSMILDVSKYAHGNYVIKIYGDNKQTFTQQFVK